MAALPLSACSVPKEVSTEAREAHVVTATYPLPRADIYGSVQNQPKVMSISPLCSFQIWCWAGTGG